MSPSRRSRYKGRGFSVQAEYRHDLVDSGNLAVKLLRTYTAQPEALQRYRGNGQQKATVEHVHVHSGGQAIVGAVTGGTGSDNAPERSFPL